MPFSMCPQFPPPDLLNGFPLSGILFRVMDLPLATHFMGLNMACP